MVCVLSAAPGYAQFGKMLKNKVKDLVTSDEAQEFVANRLSKAREEYDTISFNYAISITDDTGLFESKERFERHKKLLAGFLQKDQDKTPQQEAISHNDIGEMLYASGKYRLAEIQFWAAYLIYQDNPKLRTDLHYFRLLSNIGLLYHTMGRLTLAEEFTQQALELRREYLGESTAAYASSVNNWAVYQKDLGNFNEAETMLKTARDINLETLGEKSMPYAIALNNQAILFQTVGRTQAAEPILEKAIEIAGENLNEKSGNYQKLMINLALLYQDQEKFSEAEKIYKRVIELKERRFGKGHPDYAHALTNLASLYMDMGKVERVEYLLKESIEVYEEKFGREHPAYAGGISDLGNFYRSQERYDQALPLLKDAYEIREDKLGRNNPLFVKSKEDLAVLHWKTGEYEKAYDLYKEVMDKSLDFIHEYFPPMSESEKTRYWDILKPRFHRFNAFAMDVYQDIPAISEDVFNYQLATKALLLSATTKVRQQILSGDDEELIELYLKWVDQKEMLARFYSYSKEELSEENINLDSLEDAANSTERQLSRKSRLFSEGYSIENYQYPDIRKLLSGEEAIVDIIHVQNYDNGFTDKASYVALIATSAQERPAMVVLTNGNELEKKYYHYYKNAIKQKLEDEFSYAQYWQKIDVAIADKKRWYVSLDGIYNQINLNTLLKPDGNYVVDDVSIVYVGNTKDLVSLKKSDVNEVQARRNAVIVGFPDYGSLDLVVPLPGTKEEAEKIEALFKKRQMEADVYLGGAATESQVKSVRSPSVMHVATHGYFLEDVKEESGKVFGIEPEKAKEEPLLRSGLMLAGAEYALKQTKSGSINTADNGILTAFEAMNMNLNDTDMIVLSACETGLGDVKSGEGVYGLQRAFMVAGTKSVVMSLWKVDDDATQQLMTSFYNNWLKDGEKLEAFRAAQMSLKANYRHPYYWGAFVMMGK